MLKLIDIFILILVFILSVIIIWAIYTSANSIILEAGNPPKYTNRQTYYIFIVDILSIIYIGNIESFLKQSSKFFLHVYIHLNTRRLISYIFICACSLSIVIILILVVCQNIFIYCLYTPLICARILSR